MYMCEYIRIELFQALFSEVAELPLICFYHCMIIYLPLFLTHLLKYKTLTFVSS